MAIMDNAEFVSTVRALLKNNDPPRLDPETVRSLQAFLDKIPFYHKIEIIKGVFTPGFTTYEQTFVLSSIERYVTAGSRVLDVGCRDGLFTLVSQRKGAAEIVALDIDPSAGFRDIVAPIFDLSNVQYLIGNFLDPSVGISGQFDFIIFAGLLYHLRYPFLGLRKASDLLKEGGVMILETAYLNELPHLPILLCPVGDFSPFEPTSVTFFNRRGLSDTLASFGLKVIEVVAEFTFKLGNKTRYEELKYPTSEPRTNKGDSNIARLVWICQKVSQPPVPWTHPSLTPDVVRQYWNLTAETHTSPMWLGKRDTKPK
jgi:SAM-dependent methyltransferase